MRLITTVENTQEAIERAAAEISTYGTDIIILSKQNIDDLEQGKALVMPFMDGEYVAVITLHAPLE